MSPRFSLVTAAYNVSEFVDAFRQSVERQKFAREDFEVIVVDDGSTDDTLAKLRRWEAESPGVVRVLSQANGGQASARNLGLREATGEWVSFPDPDDRLALRYLSQVDAFLREHPQAHMVGTRRVILQHSTGELVDQHPLRGHFVDGDVLRDLSEQPDYFYSSAPCAFFRLARVRELGLEFDTDIRPNFEDGHFAARYLLAESRPLVGFVRSAAYHYRKRQDGTSTLELSVADPRRYTTVLEQGYLPLLEGGRAHHGSVPGWLQSLIIYELSWLFSPLNTVAGASRAQRGETAAQFHRLVGRIMSFIDPDLLNWSTPRQITAVVRSLLGHGYRAEPWAARDASVTVDVTAQLARIRYHYTQRAPSELVLSGGVPVEPLHAKVRDLEYHDRTLLHERILWVPADKSLRLRVDGRDVELHPLWVHPRKRTLRKRELAAIAGVEAETTLKPEQARIQRKARSGRSRRLFGDAWVLMDRIQNAGDSGEQLFEHLREHRPEINAWFVVAEETEDYKRLRRAHGRRVVAHGSDRWFQLMLNCRHVISSHADRPIMAPDRLAPYGEPSWRFTFLQHGVIKDDLSVWLNSKPLDLFVTSTAAEHASIVGDHSPYVFTTKEVVRTGLPRFDKLREVGLRYPEATRDLVLLVPTWRRWLTAMEGPDSQRHRARGDILDSEFVRSWVDYLSSPALHAVATDEGLQIAFLPHPNFEGVLDDLDLPDHVLRLSYEGVDVKEYFARAALMVTDYSSVAFNAAYIERPVLYFQFDHERVFSGEHVGQSGYFSYERDGFGPVVHALAEALGTTEAMLRSGKAPAPEYLSRINEAFPERDGRCCERVVAAIEALDRPATQ